MSIRVVISDDVLTGHPESVRDAILAGYGAGLSPSDVEIVTLAGSAVFDYAVSIGALAIVRSTTGIASYESIAANYPMIQMFMPLGSNSDVLLSDPNAIYAIVACGAGHTRDDTAYGPGLEFWDDDLDYVDPDLSSFSTGRICGKLLKIKDSLMFSWNTARALAHATASNNGVYNIYDGYGQINVLAAVSSVPLGQAGDMYYASSIRTIINSTLTHTVTDIGSSAQFYDSAGYAYSGPVVGVPSSNSLSLGMNDDLPLVDMYIFGLELTPTGVTEETTALGPREEYILEIQSMIQDAATKLTTGVGGDLDRVLSKAVSDYSTAKPLKARKRIQGDGTDVYNCMVTFGSLWNNGYSVIQDIEYPVGQKPKSVLDRRLYEIYDDGSAQDGSNLALRFTDDIIPSSEYFIVEFTVQMVLPQTGAQNFPVTSENFSNITTLASAYACQRLAAVYAQSTDATISADAVNYNDKSAKYQSLAKQYMRQYNVAVYGSEEPAASVSAAIVSGTIEKTDSTGSPYLFHRGKRYAGSR